MQRSEINALIREAEEFFAAHRFHLPRFAHWSLEDWSREREACREATDAALGWDLTDFGSGRFAELGLLLFTIRNGVAGDERYPKPYAEKIMIVDEGQVTPMHFHWKKTEDIINRGGGNLVLRLQSSDENEEVTSEEVSVQVDGRTVTVPAGGELVLEPGDSITLVPRLYHAFWGQPGRGRTLVGEVSSVNDDRTDNRFLKPAGRFPDIIEDEPPFRLLCGDYDAFLGRLP